MTANITDLLNLITSEHRQRPNYISFVSIFLQGMADIRAVAESLTEAFDLDTAVGVQLDQVGEWIGRTRALRVPISGVYFSWDVDGQGWDEAVWYQTGDPTSNIVSLPDEQYRLYLQVVAQANEWDGTIPEAERLYAILFAPGGVIVIDNQDMSMDLALFGILPDTLTLALFEGGYLDLRPAGVRINQYIIPTAPGPLFGFDIENSAIAGFGVGNFATFIPAP